MKNGILILGMLLSLSLMGQEKGKYKINGTIAKDCYEGTMVYLSKYGLLITEGWPVVDSVRVKNGKFVFQGELETGPDLYNIWFKFKDGQNKSVVLAVEPREMSVKFCEGEILASGGKVHDDYIKYVRDGSIWDGDYACFINKYASYPVVRTVVFDLMKIKDESLDTLYPKLPQGIRKRLEQEKLVWDKRMEKAMKKFKEEEKKKIPEVVREGKPYIDFCALDLSGNTFCLADKLRGKRLILLDFWATWCQPCRKEMPNIIEIYKDYRDKGLEIIGITSDRNEDSWKEMIKKSQMNWVQIMDNKNAEGKTIKSTYYIHAIPYTILIDSSTGKIVARGLRGKELREKIAELLQK